MIAFSAGGFFEGARLRAGIVVWVVAAIAALAAWPGTWPRDLRLGVAALFGLALWTLASVLWSPLKDPALGDAERVWLYAGYALLTAVAVRGRAARLLEPALAGGMTLVGLYALATRLLPGVVPSDRSLAAGARLDQPLTYWNALGLLMAMAIVLLLGLASDPTREPRLRTAAAAAVPAPGLALYLTFSRGALGALALGLIVLLALRRERRTTATTAALLGCAAAAAAAASRFPAVDSLDGKASKQGVAMLAILLVLCVLAAALHAAIERGAVDRLRLASRAGATAVLVLAVFAVGTVVAITRSPQAPAPAFGGGKTGVQLPTDRARLTTLSTNRPEYWKVALRGFADNPLKGVGAHGFQQLWTQKRRISESVQDAHSLYLETAVELGVVGVALLLAWFFALVRGTLTSPSLRLAAAPIAASIAFAGHAAVDWDWEMPAVALVFIALTTGLLASRADTAPE